MAKVLQGCVNLHSFSRGMMCFFIQAFQRLLKSGRMNQSEVDVQPYVVDGTVYLAKMDSPPAT